MVEMQCKSDAQLLHEYVARKSEPAFGEVVSFSKEVLDSFELMNVGTASIKWPGAIFARERVARPNPLGGWTRDYLFCNGSVQEAFSPDGDFDGWEQKNATQIPSPNQ